MYALHTGSVCGQIRRPIRLLVPGISSRDITLYLADGEDQPD